MNSFFIDLPIPSMGATVNELTLIDIFIERDATMAKGERIAEFESDKSVFDYEAPCAGVVREIFCRAGDVLPSGGPFLRVETADESLRHLEVRGAGVTAAKAPPQPPTPAVVQEVPAPEAPPPRPERKEPAAAPGPLWTPRAQKVAREHGLTPESLPGITGTGPGGRISGDDVLAFLEKRDAAAPAPAPAPAAAPAPQEEAGRREETVCVAGIGYAVPKKVRSNKEILKAFPHMKEEEIIRITGIEQRYYADESESVTSLSQEAVGHALSQAGIDVSEIDGIIMATIIPDQPVPSAASALAKALGLNHALAFDLNAACSGWLYALEVGRAFIRSGTARKLIVVTAELLSRITNPRDHATAFLFGDGAGAAVLTDRSGGHRLHHMELGGDATHFEAIQRAGGGARMPVPEVDGNLDHFYLSMDGPVVFKQAVIAFSNIIEETLRRHRMSAEDVSWIVPHQANERILRAVSKRVGISFEKFVVTIGKYGNTSAASVSMALGWAAEEEIFSEGDRIIFCSVGAGFTFAGGLLVW